MSCKYCGHVHGPVCEGDCPNCGESNAWYNAEWVHTILATLWIVGWVVAILTFAGCGTINTGKYETYLTKSPTAVLCIDAIKDKKGDMFELAGVFDNRRAARAAELKSRGAKCDASELPPIRSL
ncbi:MAG: hypothetical protein JSV87_02925 [Candidatus Bathyarchaeota archaeon]|nr:MAG: hypothetical protein JSV87_02925 [Candidatus Bathyarchaeota archaeon]